MAGLMAKLGEGQFCGWIGDYVERRAFFVLRDWWLRWEKLIFVEGLVATLGRRAFLWRDWWLRWEDGICGGTGGYVWRRAFLVSGLVATVGEGHLCGGIDGYVGRRSFLWRDWWLC